MVGLSDGDVDGDALGETDGLKLGLPLGDREGLALGLADGEMLGLADVKRSAASFPASLARSLRRGGTTSIAHRVRFFCSLESQCAVQLVHDPQLRQHVSLVHGSQSSVSVTFGLQVL